MNDSGDARYAPPQAQLQDLDDLASGTPASGAMASRSTRLWAALVDVAIGVALYWMLAMLLPGWRAVGGGSLVALNWKSPLISFALFAAVHGYLLVTHGQTVGKAVFRIRIVRPDGSRAGFVRLLGLRYGVGAALNVVPAVGQLFALTDVLFIFTASRRCLHDRIADTVVVQA